VLQKLLQRLLEIKNELGSDKVFDVVGEVFPSNLLERLFRDMYAQRLTAPSIEERIVREVNPERFRAITESTLEGLAKRELNLGALIGKSAEAKERRLVPEVIEDFFTAAGPVAGIHPKPIAGKPHAYRLGRVPRTLLTVGEELEPRFGRIGRTYQRVTFDKKILEEDPTLEWVTPGHPLFEVVRSDVRERVSNDLRRGAVFFDLHSSAAYRIDLFGASIKDGRGHTLHRRLFAMRTGLDGTLSVRQPTLLLDVIPAASGTPVPKDPDLPDRQHVEQALVAQALEPFLGEVSVDRARENQVVREHLQIALGELINRQNLQLAEMVSRQQEGDANPGLAGNIAQAEQHLDELNRRLETRSEQLEMERHCTIGDLLHLGRAWVLPHPDRESPDLKPMVRDDEVERIAVAEATRYEEERGFVVESVEADNRGFDLISRRPHPQDPDTFVEVRFIEVKGRAGVGEVALSSNEFKTAQRLAEDYWLYVVYNCASTPDLHVIRDPAKLGWKPVVRVEHYHLGAKEILRSGNE
jgi:hypothetical protein